MDGGITRWGVLDEVGRPCESRAGPARSPGGEAAAEPESQPGRLGGIHREFDACAILVCTAPRQFTGAENGHASCELPRGDLASEFHPARPEAPLAPLRFSSRSGPQPRVRDFLRQEHNEPLVEGETKCPGTVGAPVVAGLDGHRGRPCLLKRPGHPCTVAADDPAAGRPDAAEHRVGTAGQLSEMAPDNTRHEKGGSRAQTCRPASDKQRPPGAHDESAVPGSSGNDQSPGGRRTTSMSVTTPTARCRLIDCGHPHCCGIRKFVDSLPGLGAANANNLGQYIPIAVPMHAGRRTTAATTTRSAWSITPQKMHTDLPATRLRGYRISGRQGPTRRTTTSDR